MATTGVRPAAGHPAAAVPTPRRPRLAWVAAALGVAGIGYRLVLLVAEVPPTNSDEATTGLVALHVAQGRDLPLFFYGQYYMGALESYLAAPLFALFGPSTLALRLPNLVLYAAFLALMWRLTRRLYTAGLAAFTVGLLALGSDRILKNQLVAGGGYPEMNPAGVLLLLLAVGLGLGAIRRRGVAYLGFGLILGLTLWDDWLVLPYAAAAGALLLATGWRELRGRAGAALAAGLLGGLAPIVAHNLTAAPDNRSLAAYAALGRGAIETSWLERLHGAVLVGPPLGTGLCSPGHCSGWQLWWAVAYPPLLAAAGVLAGRALLSARGAERVRQAGRLALVVAAALTLILYATSGAAGATPVESARYLSCLLISTPAVLWPLWSTAGRPRPRAPWLASVLVLAALASTMVIATGALVAQAPRRAAEADRRRSLVAALDRMGVTRLYGEYWTCNAITFATRERLVCAVIRDDLRAGWDRYPPYAEAVAAADRPAFVLPARSALSAAVANHLRARDAAATVTTVAGYDVYRTSVPVDLPLR